MKLRRQKRIVPGLNTSSTADISFMLLVFFLVTTSMYVDKGYTRQLPPKDTKKENVEDIMVERENVMSLSLTADGTLMVNDSLPKSADMVSSLSAFILERGRKHILLISSDPQCSYEAYFHLQNDIAEAYKRVRLTVPDMPQRVAENYNE